jgi:N-acylneuraminate cytidylyltransferase
MRILTLIPARGGSKRLPGKNIKPLGGKPLINWTIESAHGIAEICDILVSTDNTEIATIAEAAGAFVPWLRPSEIATDEATSVDVASHALDWYEKEHGNVDGLLLLQPTSPFRTKETVQKGILEFSQNFCETIIGVSKVNTNPMLMVKRVEDHIIPLDFAHGLKGQSQYFSETYIVNGALYLISPFNFRNERTLFTSKMRPLIMEDDNEAIDIDTLSDFLKSERIEKKMRK